MTIDYGALEKVPRLLMEVPLRPLQGNRFQPTGFPDLGPACYTLPDGTEMLLVESTQSMANRLEAVCWDEARDDLISGLNGLPYIRINCGKFGQTNTIKQFHRLNSPYLWEGKETDSARMFRNSFLKDIGLEPTQRRKKKRQSGGEAEDLPGLLDFRKFYTAVFKWDTNSVIHGVFLEKVAGRLRMPRCLSGFIEAANVRPAESGGVKFDEILPSPKALGLSTDDGFGNVPFHRTEFVAEKITAYFNLDLALLRGYGLPEDARKLLIALALFKIRRFLSTGLRLRTACDLTTAGDLLVTQPSNGFKVPEEDSLLEECQRLIHACTQQRLFADPPVTIVQWEPNPKSQKEKAEEIDTSEEPTQEDEE